MPEPLVDVLQDAVARVPVVAASRTGSGRLLAETYGFPGSERDLHRLGLLDAGDLAPLKARVLLALALWSAPDRPATESLVRERATPVAD
ncbi:hypothetical protein [Conexibacter sp. SYSU D00693]|uniref:hypothetical protein n=1 Tax=Conexibacter sp. SYSU D00693 TaxID=2812560 RepID=UPI00196AF7C1|nr:hypothetical protein [Conexibacter sp. SYSU D00693]